jgi:transposase
MSLDALLDQVAAEAELKTGMPPGLVESKYPQVAAVSADYAFITTNHDTGRLPWSPAQDDVIRRWYGRVSRAEITRRVNEVLHRELKTDKISRSHASIACRAGAIGVQAYVGDDTEVSIKQAARELEIGYHVLQQALERGELTARRKGKQRYINRLALSNWFLRFRERQLAQAEILNAVEGEDIISKKEAMALTGLGETHITRYLKTGVIKAWKLPDLTPGGGRGEWLVQQQSAKILAAARQMGRRKLRVLFTDDYRVLQQQSNAVVEKLRRDNPDFGQPDPLTEPKSKYHPGCFTVAQVASHMQCRVHELYDAIRSGQLGARTVKRGGRLRYAIEPTEARRYAAAIKDITYRNIS